jgi:hypothetical protein
MPSFADLGCFVYAPSCCARSIGEYGPSRVKMETLLPPGPALAAVLRTTTLGSLRSTGDHDVIVVGGGAAGGLAALLLAEAGLRVLVLEAGRPPTPSGAPLRRSVGNLVRRLSSPDGLKLLPPALIPKTRAALKLLGRWRQPVQSRRRASPWSPVLSPGSMRFFTIRRHEFSMAAASG